MKYDLYFHNDFDGWASAAVMFAFLRSRGDTVEHFAPVDHDMVAQWKREDFFKSHQLFKGARNPAVVMDFPYHPRAVGWFDHHPFPFKKESWRKRFKRDHFHVLDQEYFSCAHLVYSSLKKNFKWDPPRHFAELVKWLDVVDGARFASAGQTFALKEPALQIDAFLESAKGKPGAAAKMIKLLSEKPLSVIAKLPEIKKTVHAMREEKQASLAFYKAHLKVFGNVTFIDLARSPEKFLRFAPNYLFPKVRYAVRFSMKEKLYHIGVGINPWLTSKGKIHIGQLLKRYGGGGHRGAGAVNFVSEKKAGEALREIIDLLNKK